MTLNLRFAILSDPHIALPHTIWNHPSRFHLVEYSIPALEVVLQELESHDLDFLLIPGDLTQHGEPENHVWLADRLAQLPYPVCVIPGNHDVVEQFPTDRSIGLADFPLYYEKFGYVNGDRPYYSREILPGVHIIGLNSNGFDSQGKQLHAGYLDPEQLSWLNHTLTNLQGVVFVMVHHNVIEHLPNQSHNPLGRRYMLENAGLLLQMLQEFGVSLLFTGHLHIQDVSRHQAKGYQPIYEVTTGSLVSYPHPYRILRYQQDSSSTDQASRLQIESRRVLTVPGQADLQYFSREWMGDRSVPFVIKLLTQPPLSLSIAQAEELVPALRYFWADIADGDAEFNFPSFPEEVSQYFTRFGAIDLRGKSQAIDNTLSLTLR
ncbi:MAG: metallophosphoesterase [Oscillatoriophycideae cyanobacterium NC_groundwater_1537_Pr4_S-0.65um_50_18]|nr:metallophosphoesterase [Oscillatoriophycideae cyanobacterium NC_groundwater_1537_Pr4_S-0.65um_50_18]